MTKLLDNNNYIFKYVPFNSNSLKNLINGELWFGKPKNQNDPFEGEFVIEEFSEKLSKEKKLKIIKQMFPNDNINYLKEKYDNDLNDKEFFMDYSDYMKKLIKDYFGICCFSNTYKEILLWTHYSDSHRGMCLIFVKEKLNESLTNNDSKIDGNNTIYSLNVPRIKVELHENGFPLIKGYDQLIFKYKNFIYENEFRYIKFFDPIFSEERNIKIDNSALAGIIFGESMPNDNKRTIVNLLKSIPSYSNVKIYVSTKNIVTRSIRIELVHKQHPSFYDLFKDQGAKQRFPF